MTDLEKQIIRHEDFRARLYCDKCGKDFPCNCIERGKLTWGYGWNVENNPIDEDIALYKLRNDILRCTLELRRTLKFFDKLSETRRNVLINMNYQLGLTKFLGFIKMLNALSQEDYEEAANQILDSKAARQCPNRYKELANQMKED